MPCFLKKNGYFWAQAYYNNTPYFALQNMKKNQMEHNVNEPKQRKRLNRKRRWILKCKKNTGVFIIGYFCKA